MKHWVLLFFVSALHISYCVLAETDKPLNIPQVTTPQLNLPPETPLMPVPLPTEKPEQVVQGWWGTVHAAWQQVWSTTQQAAEALQEPLAQLCDNTVKMMQEWTSDVADITHKVWADSKQWLAERGGDMVVLWLETQQWMQSLQQNWLSFSQSAPPMEGQAPPGAQGDASEAPTDWTQTIIQWVGALQTLWEAPSSSFMPPAESPAEKKIDPTVPAPTTPATPAPIPTPPAPLLTTPAPPATPPSSADATLSPHPSLSVPAVTIPPATNETSIPATH